jgi:hypothetical protein
MLIQALIVFAMVGILLVIGIAYNYGDEPRPDGVRGIVVVMIYLSVIVIFIAITRLIGAI